MRTPDRRRHIGRAFGAWIALIALAASLSLWAPSAWAQTVSPDPTNEPTPAPTSEPTVAPTSVPPTSVPPTSEPTVPPTTAPSPTRDPDPDPEPTMSVSLPPEPSGTSSPRNLPSPQGGWSADAKPRWDRAVEARKNDPLRRWRDWTPTPGTYDTSRLDRVAARMRARGWPEPAIQQEVYAPFIVVGPATWSDSWGALRLIAGPRPHTGQDILCTYGAPVLATEHGTVSWSVGTLGGLAAYLHRPDGSFYYYAHLSATPQDLSSGSAVSPGDVIGYCGASGDASVPHVHFSYVNAAGVSVDPMSRLRTWLAEAEDSLPNASDRPTEVVEESVVPATPPWSEPVFTQAPEETKAPEVVETGIPAALKHPATVPGGAVLLGLPLLGLLRRRTREHQT